MSGDAELSSRDALRAKLLKSKQFRFEEIVLFGAKVEVRQPSVGAILDAQENPDRKAAIVDMLIGYCYVPGTKEKIFDEGDRAAILQWPFGEDMVRLSRTIENMTSIDIASAEKN